jgi:glycine C-acetyltransferase
MDKLSFLKSRIQELKDQGLFFNIPIIESPPDAYIIVNGKRVINLCSNNYLGLANHPRLKKAAQKAIEKYGIGPAAVRSIAGTTPLHIELEKRLATFKKQEAVITFQSGFMANLAVIPALVGEEDLVLSDELNHASIIDGIRLSKAEKIIYQHANVDDLEAKLKKAVSSKKYKRYLIITDGVFSMDGDIAPLPKLAEIAKKYNALLAVDDAHGEGVLGKNGRGIVDHFNLHGKVDIEIGTMSKAFGVVGGIVAAKKTIIQWLTQRARPFLFSSAMTIPDVAACIEAVKILENGESRIKKLWSNTLFFKKGMKQLGFNIGNSQTPIVPVMIGDADLAQRASRMLLEKGVFAKAIGYPTVPQGKARIRVMNSALHTKKDLTKCLAIFEYVGKRLKLI